MSLAPLYCIIFIIQIGKPAKFVKILLYLAPKNRKAMIVYRGSFSKLSKYCSAPTPFAYSYCRRSRSQLPYSLKSLKGKTISFKISKAFYHVQHKNPLSKLLVYCQITSLSSTSALLLHIRSIVNGANGYPASPHSFHVSVPQGSVVPPVLLARIMLRFHL